MCKRLFVLFCLVILIVACQPTEKAETAEMTGEQRQAIAAEIRQINQEFFDLNMLMDEEKYNKGLTFWADSDDPAWMGNPAIFVNRTSIITTNEAFDEFWRPLIGTRGITNFTMGTDCVAVLSPDLAIHVYDAKYSITNLEGETGPEYPMTATSVFVKKDGEWKILHHHQSWSETPIETEKEEPEK